MKSAVIRFVLFTAIFMSVKIVTDPTLRIVIMLPLVMGLWCYAYYEGWVNRGEL